MSGFSRTKMNNGRSVRLQPDGGDSKETLRVRRDAQPGGRPPVQHLRLDHDPQRQLLQVRQLRHDERLRVGGTQSDNGKADLAVRLSYVRDRRPDAKPAP